MSPLATELFRQVDDHVTDARDHVTDAARPDGSYSPENLLVSLAHLRRALLSLDELRELVEGIDGEGPSGGEPSEIHGMASSLQSKARPQ